MGLSVLAQDRRLPAFPAAADMFVEPIPREHFFSDDSYWYRPVTNYTPYQHPTIPQANSTNWKNSLCQQMLINPTTGAWVGGSSYAYLALWGGISLYVVPADYPRRPFSIVGYNMQVQGAGALDTQLRAGVPAPLSLVTGGGNDNSAILYQPSTDSLWELFALTKSNQANSYYDVAGWAAVVYGMSTFRGTFKDLYRSDGVQIQGQRWGASGTSISLAAGITDVDEVRTGVINHALPLVVGRAQASPLAFVAPATRGDGIEYNRPDFIPEGARIVFPPTADFSRVRPEFMPFARAIQNYGLIPMDKTGGQGTAIKIRQGQPWEDVLTLYQTDALAGWRYMSSLPWHQAIIIDPAFSL